MRQTRTLPQWHGWLFIAPALLFVAVFVLIPLGQLAAVSLTDRSLLGGGKLIGFTNYRPSTRSCSRPF
jgi:ABC-type sugar transport system permease subunit